MHFSQIALSLAAVAFVKADLKLDDDDIPTQCNAVCRPIYDLGRACDVDDDRVRDDRTEDYLEAQCVCTNNSINVSQYAALCASCMDQNVRDRDDLDDIRDILRTCGFASTSYASTASYASSTPTVQAVRPTASSQLTTTITPGAVVGASSTQSSSGNSNSNGGSNSSPTTAGSQATQTPNAAGIVSPKAGLGLIGAAAVGALIL